MHEEVILNIKAEKIKPAIRGVSDFFSWQLYRWVKRHPRYIQVYLGKWDQTGYSHDKEVLYIGQMHDGAFFGNRLRRICSHGHNLQAFSYESSKMHLAEWVEHTEQFWSDYQRIGVCAIHGDGAHEWVESGDMRACKYCGTIQHKTVQLIERTNWTNTGYGTDGAKTISSICNDITNQIPTH